MTSLVNNCQRSVDRADFCLKMTGTNLFDNNKYAKALLIFVLIDSITYYFVNISSVARYSDLLLQLYCFVTFGLGIQFYTLAFHFVYFKSILLDMYRRLLNIYIKPPFFGETRVHLVLKNYSAITWKTNSVLFSILIGSAIALTLYPIIHWIFTGQLYLVFGFLLPYTYPEKGFFDYFLNFVYQGIQINYVSIFLTGVQLYLALFILHGCCQIDVIKALLTDIWDTSDSKNSHKEYGEQNIGKKLRFIIEYHQNYLQYLLMMDLVFRWQLFIGLVCIVFQMAVGLLIVTQITWIPGYFTIIFGTVELFLSCFFGTLIETKNDELMDAIYATPWYLFRIPDRKLLLTFLMASQNPRQLMFGQFLPINLQTFLAVIKTIYSYLMMLMNFIE